MDVVCISWYWYTEWQRLKKWKVWQHQMFSVFCCCLVKQNYSQAHTHTQPLVLNCITVIQTDLMNDEQTVNKCLLKIWFLFSLNDIWSNKYMKIVWSVRLMKFKISVPNSVDARALFWLESEHIKTLHHHPPADTRTYSHSIVQSHLEFKMGPNLIVVNFSALDINQNSEYLSLMYSFQRWEADPSFSCGLKFPE